MICIRKLVFMIFIPLFIFSCDATETEVIKSADKYYPMSIGNKWEYSYGSESAYAVVERIIKNNKTHEDGSNIWGYTEAVKVTDPNPNEPIVAYYSFKSDGLYYYSSDKDTMVSGTNILCGKDLILKSPVKVGEEWVNSTGANSRIISIGNFKVLNKNYPETVLVVTEKDGNVDSSWYALNVGLVRRVNHILIGQPYSSIVKWELKDYSLL